VMLSRWSGADQPSAPPAALWRP